MSEFRSRVISALSYANFGYRDRMGHARTVQGDKAEIYEIGAVLMYPIDLVKGFFKYVPRSQDSY